MGRIITPTRRRSGSNDVRRREPMEREEAWASESGAAAAVRFRSTGHWRSAAVLTSCIGVNEASSEARSTTSSRRQAGCRRWLRTVREQLQQYVLVTLVGYSCSQLDDALARVGLSSRKVTRQTGGHCAIPFPYFVTQLGFPSTADAMLSAYTGHPGWCLAWRK
jgi:hypothetical protein